MMGFFKGLLSPDKIVDAGIRAADAVVFTDEERQNFLLEYAKATLPMSRARRFIAIVVSLEWFVCTNICLVLLLINHEKFEPMAEFSLKIVGPQFGIVMAFYFLAQVVSRAKN